MTINTLADLDGLAAQALTRMDSKGEEIAAAVEAVTGGQPALGALVTRRLRGGAA